MQRFNLSQWAITHRPLVLFAIILLGAELNAETQKRYDAKLIEDKLTDPRKQLPGEQPAPDPRAAREAGVTPAQVVATNAASAAKVQAGKASAASPTLANAAVHEGTAAEPAEGARRKGHLRPDPG